jgi:mRNA-degrading endonuclease RelE of RelBE toxin-antitoxin system
VNWKIEFDDYAAKEFKKLDKPNQILIANYLKQTISTSNNSKNLANL